MLVTPDGERTMNTYLGAAQDPAPADIDEKRSRLRHRSISKAICGTRRTPRKPSEGRRDRAWRERMVALTLSDAFCVDRYRDEFLNLMRDGAVDLLFANESELKSLYETADFDTAVTALRNDVKLAVVTRSEKGCVVVSRDERSSRCRRRRSRSSSMRPAPAICSLPASLTGHRARAGPRNCARLGALAAAEVSSISARGRKRRSRPSRGEKSFTI